MRKRIFAFAVLLLCLIPSSPAFGRSTKGVINGAVKDAEDAVRRDAKVDYPPQLSPVTTDEPDDFIMTEVNPASTPSPLPTLA